MHHSPGLLILNPGMSWRERPGASPEWEISGRRVAKAAEALGCKVIFFATSGHSDCRDYERVDWDTLLAQSDILSLHCPLSDRTFHLMNADAFSKMKKERSVDQCGARCGCGYGCAV